MKSELIVAVVFCCSKPFQPDASDSITRIAVYAIKSETLSKTFTEALSDHIESRLLRYPGLRVIARSNLDVLISEGNLLESGIMTDRERVHGQANLSLIDEVCTGSLRRVGDGYRFTLKLINVRTGRIDASIQKHYCGPEHGVISFSTSMVDQVCAQQNWRIPRNHENGTDVDTAAEDSVSMRLKKSISVVDVNKQRKEVEPKKTAVEQAKENPEERSGRTVSNQKVPGRSVADGKPSRLGKRVAIGAVAIFTLVAGIIVMAHH